MATMVLSAAGAAVGGPVGGAIGSFLGRQVDRSFSEPGPRLSDLRVPSAQYGDSIPAIVGRMRVAGIVLWASEPVATATVSKNGTGNGSSVSFAYGLSSGRVERVLRIWADGRLIRDAEGQQDVSFEMRLHGGDEDQASDPLIASVQGEDRAPAYRGIAYLVFENFDLSSFGSRLPLLTVEIAERATVTTAEEVISNGLEIAYASGANCHEVVGYALAGDDCGNALVPLQQAFGSRFAYSDASWTLQQSSALHLIPADLWCLQDCRTETTSSDRRAETPTRVSLRYFDPARDFAASERSARLPGAEKLRRVELAAALESNQAKALAFERLAEVTAASSERWLTLPLSYMNICVGDQVGCSKAPAERLRVSQKQVAAGVLRLTLAADAQRISPLTAETSSVASARRLHRAPLSIALVELPISASSREMDVAVLVSGGHDPYQPMLLTIDAGPDQHQLQSAAIASPRGYLDEPLPSGSGNIMERAAVLSVTFERDPYLVSCDEAALLAGANLLCIDGEFLQFATARPLGGNSYLLSHLLRGRFDTAAVTHDRHSAVSLLNPGSFTRFTLPISMVGSRVSARVEGPDATTVETSLTLAGHATRPWAPAHVQSCQRPDGLHLSWVRRCSDGLSWLDGVDAPLGASREAYDLQLTGQHGQIVRMNSSAPSALIDKQSTDTLGRKPWQLELRQLGDFAAGESCTHIIN